GVEVRPAFHSSEICALEERGEIQAPGYRPPIHEHGAAAAKSLAAALARSMQAEAVAQHLDDVLVRRHLRLHCLAVQTELDGLSHFTSSLNTASGVSGSEVRRTPTASCIALAIAGETPKVPVSPTPLAPN